MSVVPISRTSIAPRAARPMANPIVQIALGVAAVAIPVAVTLWLAHATLDKSLRVMWPQFLAAALCVCGYCFYVHEIERRSVAELARVGAWRGVAMGVLGSAFRHH